MHLGRLGALAPSPKCIGRRTASGTTPVQRLSTKARAGPEEDKLKEKFFGEGAEAGKGDEEEEPSSSLKPEEYLGRWLQGPAVLGRQARDALDRKGVDMQGVDAINPFQLGAKARRAFDTAWTQLSQLSAPTKSVIYDDFSSDLSTSMDMDVVPQAASTTVLVVGATDQVGRILTRKLLLRGYKVRALVRVKERGEDGTVDGVPTAVKVLFGDAGEMRDCQEAVRGVNKVRHACMQACVHSNHACTHAWRGARWLQV